VHQIRQSGHAGNEETIFSMLTLVGFEPIERGGCAVRFGSAQGTLISSLQRGPEVQYFSWVASVEEIRLDTFTL
jgi:hypothetical protein